MFLANSLLMVFLFCKIEMDPNFITPLNRLSNPHADILSNLYGEHLIEFISYLKESHAKASQERFVPGTLPLLMLPSTVVCFFFKICSALSLSTEVKYIAMEIFDRFVTRHFSQINEYTRSASKNPAIVKKKWIFMVKRVEKQMLLRILSSIQIASKMDYQPQSIGIKAVHDFLRQAGLPYQMKSIFKSELRIFRTLDLKIPWWSPLTFIHTILEALQSWTNIDAVIPVCEEVLEATLLNREEVYLRFFWMGTKRWERTNEEKLGCAGVEMNYFLLASAVVLSALWINPIAELDFTKTSQILAELVTTPQKEMQALSLVILQMIFGSTRINENLWLNK